MIDTANTAPHMSRTGPPADWDGSYYHVRFPHLTLNAETQPGVREMMLAAQAASAEADTYDWDTVFAIKFKDVNKALARSGTTPATFEKSESTTESHLSGKFGAWRLSGGGDTLLHMEIPITSGTLQYTDIQKHQHDVNLAGVSATIEIELSQLPQPQPVANHKAQTTSTGGHTVAFKAKDDLTVTVTELQNMPPDAGFQAQILVQGLMSLWFNENLGKFTYAFASVDLNAKADQDGYQWLQPKYVGYAVSQRASVDESVFAVLCMIDDAPAAPPTMQVSPNAIPEGQESGFLISQKNFLLHLVLPGIYTMFDGAKASDFQLNEDGTVIFNKNTVTMKKTGDSHYQPKCGPNTVQVTMVGSSELQLALLKAVVDFSPGITIVMTYTMYSKIVLDKNSKGEPVLNYAKAREPIVDHNIEVASWVIWTQVAASVAIAVATLGTGVAIKRMCERIAIKLVALIISAMVLELIANIAAIIEAIATGDKDKLPTVDLMAINATNPITWTDSGDFTITSAGLAKSLQLGGNPNFITG